MTRAIDGIDTALSRLYAAIAAAEVAAVATLIRADASDLRKAARVREACRAVRRILGSGDDSAERVLDGLNEGRQRAHERKRSERTARDAKLTAEWQAFSSAGWDERAIVETLAQRQGVQPRAVKRRARRLGLIGPALTKQVDSRASVQRHERTDITSTSRGGTPSGS